jgi:hypothetical protein
MFLLEVAQKTLFFPRFKTFKGDIIVRKALKTDKHLHFGAHGGLTFQISSRRVFDTAK